MKRICVRFSISACALLIAGCGMMDTGSKLRSVSLGDSEALASTAELRFVLARPDPEWKRANAQRGSASTAAGGIPYAVCAEPSPDVAKAVADALSHSANVTASGLPQLGSGASVGATAGFALSQTTAIAELGRRFATTQVLREGEYRLCEAYANGVISKYEYALALSRYGDTMVTMLAIEAVSGMSNNLPVAALTAQASAVNPYGQNGGNTQNQKAGQSQNGQQQTSMTNDEINDQYAKADVPTKGARDQNSRLTKLESGAPGKPTSGDQSKNATPQTGTLKANGLMKVGFLATQTSDDGAVLAPAIPVASGHAGGIERVATAPDVASDAAAPVKHTAPAAPKKKASVAKHAPTPDAPQSASQPGTADATKDANATLSTMAQAIDDIHKRYIQQSNYAPMMFLCATSLNDASSKDGASPGAEAMRNACEQAMPALMNVMLNADPPATNGRALPAISPVTVPTLPDKFAPQ